MHQPDHYDALIIGGGPAGTCAALRLLGMGHKVALVERASFPRSQIGESLSPGIRNLMDYLQAGHLLAEPAYRHGLPARVIWETQAARTLEGSHRGAGVMADRGRLDAALLGLAVARGLHLFQPAAFTSCIRKEGRWQVQLPGRDRLLTGTFLLDARGRRGVTAAQRILTAPPAVAVWAHVPAGALPPETRVEALAGGWLWGSPTSGGHSYRVMAFTDPAASKKTPPAALLKGLVAEATLFKRALAGAAWSPVEACPVLQYCHATPWQEAYVRLGEAAFTLDPLSSTGVEKAMRCTLQATIAVNTVLQTGQAQLAQAFYEDRLTESVATHTGWTRRYYAQAWPGETHDFWGMRGKPSPAMPSGSSPLHRLLAERLAAAVAGEPAGEPATGGIEVQKCVAALWHQKPGVSPDLTYPYATCVADDCLRVKKGVKPPRLRREIVYLDGIEVLPLLAAVAASPTFGDLLYHWSATMTFEQAARLVAGLWNLDILCVQP